MAGVLAVAVMFDFILLATGEVPYTILELFESGPKEVTCRWSATMARMGPWGAPAHVTGTTVYVLDDAGVIISHSDEWDFVDDQGPFSMEAVTKLWDQVSLPNPSRTARPLSETPAFTLLRKGPLYEVRHYEPMSLVTAPNAASTVKSAAALRPLWQYVRGANESSTFLDSPGPIITCSAGFAPSPSTYAFPFPNALDGSTPVLPVPTATALARKVIPRAKFAALEFRGWPLESEVREAEEKLRGALDADGLRAQDGFMLLRYNKGLALPQLCRNEVLVRMNGDEA